MMKMQKVILQMLGLKEIKTINYPTKYDTIYYFVKDNKIRLYKRNFFIPT